MTHTLAKPAKHHSQRGGAFLFSGFSPAFLILFLGFKREEKEKKRQEKEKKSEEKTKKRQEK